MFHLSPAPLLLHISLAQNLPLYNLYAVAKYSHKLGVDKFRRMKALDSNRSYEANSTEALSTSDSDDVDDERDIGGCDDDDDDDNNNDEDDSDSNCRSGINSSLDNWPDKDGVDNDKDC